MIKKKDRSSALRWHYANLQRSRDNRKRWYRANKAYRAVYLRRWRYRTLYNLTPEGKTALLKAQGGRCAICQTKDPGRRGWVVDHIPRTKIIRGVLCQKCNLGLGHFKDKIKFLKAALMYLTLHIGG